MLFETTVRALTGPEIDWELDPSIRLHARWEAPAWDLARAVQPAALRWLTPQAPLDTLAGMDSNSAWIDFLYCSPWRQVDHGIEFDGSQHNAQRGSDHARNRMLSSPGFTVHRVDGPDTVGEDGEFASLLKNLAKQSGRVALDYEPPNPPSEQSPRRWSERDERAGWDIGYTVLGGSLRSGDPLNGLQGAASEKILRLSSQVFTATTTGTGPPSNDVSYWATICLKVLQRGDRPPITHRTQRLLETGFATPEGSDTVEAIGERLIGPAAVQRFGLALIKAVHACHLIPGKPWNIRLDDVTGLVELAAGGVLDLLAAIDDVWSTGIVPSEVSINDTAWRRRGQRFESSQRPATGEVALTVVLDPYRPAHAALPTTNTPAVVIRSTYLPIRPSWLESPSNERRNIVPSPQCQAALHVLLIDLFGHEDFREGQLGAIIRALAGRDTAVMLPTGTGKSLIFQIAGLLRPGLTIAVDPLVSLIDDQSRGLIDQGISRVAKLHSDSLRGSDGERLLASVGRGDALFAFLTPERLQTVKFRTQFETVAEKVLVNLAIVDEAHCVSEWGHDFRTAYLNVGRNLRKYGSDENSIEPPLLALTATASPTVRRDMFRELNFDETDPEAIQTPSSHERPNLHLGIHLGASQDRRSRLTNIVFAELPEELGEEPTEVLSQRGSETSSMIVFVPHVGGQFGIVKIREFLENQAASRGVATGVGYYGGEPKDWKGPDWDEVRREEARAFIENENVILVATKGFGMGIDKPNIRATVHYGMPGSVEAFAQEYGRAGRDGADSYCYLSARLPNDELADSLLDLHADLETRRDRYEQRSARFNWTDPNRENPLPLSEQTDIDQQLFFHFLSFPGAETETTNAQNLLTELWNGTTETVGDTIGVPRSRWPGQRGGSDSVATLRERALYRLSLLGLVYDYTVQYPGFTGGADSFTVELVNFDASSIDTAIRAHGQTLEPGRGLVLNQEIADAPQSLDERCRHHLRLLVDMFYRNIEPARSLAIDEMRRVAISGLDSDALAARIGAYLGDGLLASSLDSTIHSLQLTATNEAMVTILQTLPLVNENERDGATTSQLERTRNHPVALLARAATIAQSQAGNRDDYTPLIQQAFKEMDTYVPDDREAGRIFRSIRDHVLSHGFGNRNWVSDLWSAWPNDRLEAIGDLATEIMEAQSWQDAAEREAVLVARLSIDATDASNYVMTNVGGPADEQ